MLRLTRPLEAGQAPARPKEEERADSGATMPNRWRSIDPPALTRFFVWSQETA